ncbi:bi-domain-containing oxidoreductase [Amylibacter sp.]|nr:bi-domain-containing oxidoreductase [Amylibacter sp.]
MKQIIQNMSNGETQLVEVPIPKELSGSLLVSTSKSLLSTGTERMLINFGKANWLQRVRRHPDKVHMVLDKIKNDGLVSTIDAIKSQLDKPILLGYCNVGKVVANSNTKYKIGERVASNGSHAEVIRTPVNLCARIPDNVTDEQATFTVIGAIALQGVRLIKPSLGETIVVTGLGLIGLLTVQILKANGCRVIGIDYETQKCELAKKFGAEVINLSKNQNPIIVTEALTEGLRVDGVIVTATSASDEPISQAANMCRKRGRIVLVGVVGLNINRSEFYEKELSFQVSCSYGPGRYDENYEEGGNDYPIGYVRWTEQRNFEAVLGLLSDGKIDVKPLITSQYDIINSLNAYAELDDKSSLGIILNYPQNVTVNEESKKIKFRTSKKKINSEVVLGFIGAGNYASRILLPAFKSSGAKMHTIASSGGVSAFHLGRKYNFENATSDLKTIYDDRDINTVVIATRHNQHSVQICDALMSGKHVFVEKPLATTLDEIDKIEKTYSKQIEKPKLMVGYNRRFSPHIKTMKSLIEPLYCPKVIIMTMSAGKIPSEHWTQNPSSGGGRIIGEACHYIDLMRHLIGKEIISHNAICINPKAKSDIAEDKAIINLKFADGSIGSINYLSNGGKKFPKERIEIFANDAVLQLDNFKTLQGFGWPKFKKQTLFKQNKGQFECTKAFVDNIKGGKEPPISFSEIIEVARLTVQISTELNS